MSRTLNEWLDFFSDDEIGIIILHFGKQIIKILYGEEGDEEILKRFENEKYFISEFNEAVNDVPAILVLRR